MMMKNKASFSNFCYLRTSRFVNFTIGQLVLRLDFGYDEVRLNRYNLKQLLIYPEQACIYWNQGKSLTAK